MTESQEQKVRRVTAERVDVVEYDPHWPAMFEQERIRLLRDLPAGMILNIEHYGSTAVAGLVAKPVIDVLIEVRDVEEARVIVPEILEPQGCDCFWRPTRGDDTPPWYTWCIRRDAAGRRTHHLHFGGIGFKAKEQRFGDLLRSDADLAAAYGALKLRLAREHADDRVRYTDAKTGFIERALTDAHGPGKQ
jgi:GrpB-like predicted nucleotidyltransferase (UPF0157 family)